MVLRFHDGQSYNDVDDDNPLPVKVVTDAAQSDDILTGQVSVGTTMTLIVAANPARKSVLITNITGTQVIYVGPLGVTTSNGSYLHSAAGSNVTINTKAAVYGIAVTAAQTVSYLEEQS